MSLDLGTLTGYLELDGGQFDSTIFDLSSEDRRGQLVNQAGGVVFS